MPKYGVNRKKLVRLVFESDGVVKEFRMCERKLAKLVDKNSYKASKLFCKDYGLQHRWQRIDGIRYQLIVTGFKPIVVEATNENFAHKLAMLKLHKRFHKFQQIK